MPNLRDPNAIPPDEALARLMAGNERFVRSLGQAGRDPRPDLAGGQRPVAVVIGCSDSRTPVEMLFDQTFGDIFVVRVAGAVVSPAVVGSVEFGVSMFGIRLIVMLGHTRCGAVSATAQALKGDYVHPSTHIQFLTDLMTPLIQSHLDPVAPLGLPSLRTAGRAAIAAGPASLVAASPLLKELVDEGRVLIAPAEYELETGRVHWLPR